MKAVIKLDSRKNSDGKFRLIFFIRNGEKKMQESLGIFLSKEEWDGADYISNSSQQSYEIDLSIDEKKSLLKKANHKALINNWSAEKLMNYLNAEGDENKLKVDIKSYSKIIIERNQKTGHHGNAETYKTAINSLIKYNYEHKLLFEDINYNFLIGWKTLLLSKNISHSTIKSYFVAIKAIFNDAIKAEITSSINPFNVKGLIPKARKSPDKGLSSNHINLIESYEPKRNSRLFHTRNIFLLGFYLRGIDYMDIVLMKEGNLINGRYVARSRKKMRNRDEQTPLSIKVFPKAQKIIDYYLKNKSEYLLPLVKAHPDESHESYRKFRNKRGEYIKQFNKMGKILNLPFKLTTKSIRHTFSTIARNEKNIDIGIIQELIGHSRNEVIDSYLNKFSEKQLDKAHSEVINLN